MSKAEIFINGKVHTISFTPPVRLSKLITSCGVPFSFPCSGQQICGQCKIIAKGVLSPVTDREKECLGSAIKSGYRLACSADALGDVTICDVPVSSAPKAEIQSDRFYVKNPLGKNFGVAFDIGTTTVAAYLCNMKDGKLICSLSLPNPQSVFGADVLSRIKSALDGNLNKLSALIRDALKYALLSLCKTAKIDTDEVDACVITGNTTMLFLLSNRSPESISHAPFESEELFGYFEEADFLPLKQGTKAYFVKCISAFIGGDITCSILASSLCSGSHFTSGSRLLTDIGTNGETVLLKHGKLYACSCAAGPAFECVGISHGTSAVSGAVNSVKHKNGVFSYSVIGNTSPVGFCGTGLIDMVSCLIDAKVLDTSGLLDAEVYLNGTDILINQKDIRQLQLAKSAVLSGIEALLHFTDTDFESLFSFEIAGSFGSFVSIDSASNIGMIPKSLKEKTTSIGNASGTGACKILFDKSLIGFIDSFTDKVSHIELATNEYFADRFINNISFS